MLFDCCWVLKCFHRVIYHTIKSYSCLVTASSEPTILQVNFDCLLLPNCITWQLSKMCIICHFWQITQSEIILHTALAFNAVNISVAFRKPSDFTVCSFYLTIYQTQASSCDLPCFENCCILLIYLPILGLCLSCYVYVSLWWGALSKTLWKFKETTSAVAPLSIYFLALQRISRYA